MSYSIGGLIQSADYNGFANTNSPNVNSVWASGSSNTGYGQSPLATVTTATKVSFTNWANLISTISNIAAHQGSTITTLSPAPSLGGKIKGFVPTLNDNINTIYTNRLNANSQGTDSTTTITNSISSWVDTLTMTFTLTFVSANAIRYFFNGGGQLGLSFSHPTGPTIDALISDICSEIGTIWLSGTNSGTVTLSGTTFNGVTKIGGVASIRGTANINNGFYNWTGVASNCYRQYGDVPYGSYTAGTFLDILAQYNGTTGITITCLFDEIPNGAIASTGTQATLTVRPPSATYLTNTWGSPVISSNIVPI